jgi:hypothetical protein
MWKNRAVQVSLVKKNDNTTPDVENTKTDPETIAKIAGGMVKETLIVAVVGVGALIVLNAACQIAVNALKADDK